MLGKKAKRIRELEAKIDCYVAREYKNRNRLEEKERKIEELINEKNEQNKKIQQQDKIIKIQSTNLKSQDKEIGELKIKLKYYIGWYGKNAEKRSLEQIRIDSGMTKTEVAKKMGSNSIFYLSQVEKGRVNPSLEYIQKLAKVYKIPPAKIVESLTKDDVSGVKNARRNRK